MSAVKFIMNGHEIDATPRMLPDGRYVALAIVVRQADGKAEELWPDFEPFATEAEAASAAHLAAVSWIAHQSGIDRGTKPTT